LLISLKNVRDEDRILPQLGKGINYETDTYEDVNTHEIILIILATDKLQTQTNSEGNRYMMDKIEALLCWTHAGRCHDLLDRLWKMSQTMVTRIAYDSIFKKLEDIKIKYDLDVDVTRNMAKMVCQLTTIIPNVSGIVGFSAQLLYSLCTQDGRLSQTMLLKYADDKELDDFTDPVYFGKTRLLTDHTTNKIQKQVDTNYLDGLNALVGANWYEGQAFHVSNLMKLLALKDYLFSILNKPEYGIYRLYKTSMISTELYVFLDQFANVTDLNEYLIII
jgi:hypothetical protein